MDGMGRSGTGECDSLARPRVDARRRAVFLSTTGGRPTKRDGASKFRARGQSRATEPATLRKATCTSRGPQAERRSKEREPMN